MPIYEYECNDCGKTVEAIQRLDDPPLTVCAECGGALRKRLSAPAFQFKGSGWYVTDYTDRGKAGKEEAKSAAKESSDKETKSEGGKAADGGKSGGAAASASSSD